MPNKKNVVPVQTVVDCDPNEAMKRILKANTALNAKLFGGANEIKQGTEIVRHLRVIKTGSLALDAATGCGGIPRGRITEIFGPEGAGKSTLAMSIMIQAQKEGGVAGMVETEQRWNMDLFIKMGGDPSRFFIVQPLTGEEQMEVAEAWIKTGAFSVVCLDSVEGVTPQAELEGSFSDHFIGLKGRFMGTSLRKLGWAIARSDTAFVCINQVREKIGGYGNPEVTPGGRALKFWSSLRLRIAKGEAADPAKKKKLGPGHNLSIRIIKTGWRGAGEKVEPYLIYGKGFDYVEDLLSTSVELGVVTLAGAYKRWIQTSTGETFQWKNRAEFEDLIVGNTDMGIFQEFEDVVHDRLYNTTPVEGGFDLDPEEVEPDPEGAPDESI